MNYLLVTHFYADGPAQALCKYLQKKKANFRYIEHPFSYADRKNSHYLNYEKGEKIKSKKGRNFGKNDLILYFKDFFGTIFTNISQKFDLAIGFDNLNTLALIALKKLGRAKKVIYVTVDYTPQRFPNKTLNKIYHFIDRFCCYHADLLWDSTELMKDARIKHKVKEKKLKSVIVVEDGNYFREHRLIKEENLNKYQLVYMGHVREMQGIDLLIDSFKDLHNWNNEINLLIIGGGPLLDHYKEKAQNMELQNAIKFTGFIDSHEEVEDLLLQSYLAFALYETDPKSFSQYSAVGKPKVYMSCGLPVIITDVPEIAKKIDSFGSGKIVNYDKSSVVACVKEIIENPALYSGMRQKAIEFAKRSTWENVFNEAFVETDKIFKR